MNTYEMKLYVAEGVRYSGYHERGNFSYLKHRGVEALNSLGEEKIKEEWKGDTFKLKGLNGVEVVITPFIDRKIGENYYIDWYVLKANGLWTLYRQYIDEELYEDITEGWFGENDKSDMADEFCDYEDDSEVIFFKGVGELDG